jgi:hypothetical protein
MLHAHPRAVRSHPLPEPVPGITLPHIKSGMKTIDRLTGIAFSEDDTELSEEAIAALWRLGAYIHYSVTSVYAYRNQRINQDTGEIREVSPSLLL